jgi:hypothetical protein
MERIDADADLPELCRKAHDQNLLGWEVFTLRRIAGLDEHTGAVVWLWKISK